MAFLLLRKTGIKIKKHAKRKTCKDRIRKSSFRKTVPLDEIKESCVSEIPESNLLEKCMKLPEKYRISLFLHYYEGFKVNEIASMLGKRPNTVSAYLSRGKKKLKSLLDREV